MNKNRVKAIIISVAVTVGVASGFLAPLASAATSSGGGGNSGSYIQIPLAYTRTPATLKNGATSCKTFSSTDCYDVASGIGMYAYVSGNHTPERANIGFDATGITVVDTTANTQDYTSNFTVDKNGVLQIYGLTVGHAYNFSFAYNDAKSSDIVAAIKQTAQYCTRGTITSKSDGTIGYRISQQLSKGCDRYNKEPFLPASVTEVVPAAQGATVTLTRSGQKVDPLSIQAPASSSTGNTDTGDDCPLAAGAPLRWLGCPLIAIGASAAQGLEGLIQQFLYTPVTQIFDSDGFKATANTFRVLGIALILIAGLVMVISQAAGLELFDAYTVRKVLPRLAVALIGMAIAWPVLKFIVIFFNDLGLWASSLIGSIPHVSTQAQDGQGAGGLLSGAVVVAGGGIAMATLGFGGIVSLLGTLILALLVGFAVLAIRQMVILVVVLMAPLAIAAYVLPGTQKLWHFWREALTTTLVMYPLIMMFLASGQALSSLLSNAHSNSMTILAVFVYFAPFFLLPFAFKLAGGLMSTVFSMANDRGKGGFDRLKKYRQGKTAENLHAMKAGNRYKGSSFAARGFNATTRNAANLANAGVVPWKMRSRMQAAGASSSAATLAEYMDKDVAFSAIKGNDDYLQATMKNMGGGSNESDWRRYLSKHGYEGRSLEQGVAAIRSAKRNVSNDVFERAAVMANAATGTGWKEGGVTQMMESINDAAGGDRHTAQTMLAQMRSMAGQAGRLDLGGMGFGTQASVLNDMYTEKAQTGSLSAAGLADAKHKLHGNLLETKGAGEFARARGNAVMQIAPEMLHDLRQAHAKVDALPMGSEDRKRAERELAQKYASMANFHDSLNHMSPENAKLIADNVLSQQIYAGDTTTVLDRIDQYRQTKNPDYLYTRKDYDARQYREEGAPPEPPA